MGLLKAKDKTEIMKTATEKWLIMYKESPAKIWSGLLKRNLAGHRAVWWYAGWGKSRFTLVCVESNIIITDDDTRINSVLCILTTVNLLLLYPVFKALREMKCQLKILHSANMYVKIKGQIEIFPDKHVWRSSIPIDLQESKCQRQSLRWQERTLSSNSKPHETITIPGKSKSMGKC